MMKNILIGISIMVLLVIPLYLFQGDNNITGMVVNNQTVNTTLTVVNWTIANCSFLLYKGWNLVSFYCFASINRSEALQPIDGKYEAIFTYDNQHKEWKAYNPNLPSYVIQDLDIIDRKNGYWIYMNETSFFNKQGYKSAYTSIPLYVGWNLIGYPTNTTINASILNNLDQNITWMHQDIEKKWYYYINGSNHTFNYLYPYQGYWIQSNSEQTWRIDW